MSRHSMTAQEAIELYDEPCNNCKRWVRGSWCARAHRQKKIQITTGHIPELTFRRIGGCDDHALKVGTWWHEDPIKPHQCGYGGSSTNILL